MIKKYNEFINENNSIPIDIDLGYKSLKTLPEVKDISILGVKVKVNEIIRDYNCSENLLGNLINSPYKIIGDFNCSDNLITSLEGCPKFIGGDFICKKIKLSEKNYYFPIFEDYPLSIIDGDLYIDFNGAKLHELHRLIQKNRELFVPLVDDKIKFHQMIMRIKPEYMDEKYYQNIPYPSKKSTLLI